MWTSQYPIRNRQGGAAQKMDSLRVANSLWPKGKTPLRNGICVAPPFAPRQSFFAKTPFAIGA
jgi:hypothetical protein